MKKWGKVFVAMGLAVALLCGCGGSRPVDVSQDMYDLGVKALDIVDKYLSAELEADEAKKQLGNIYDLMIEEEGFSSDGIIKGSVNLITSELDDKITENSIKDIKARRETLQEYLNK